MAKYDNKKSYILQFGEKILIFEPTLEITKVIIKEFLYSPILILDESHGI